MARLPLLFMFLILFICFAPKIADANSYKTQNLKHNIKVDIPIGWKILPQNMLRQLDNATEASLGVDQSNNEILIGANCYTLNKKPSATFRISVRKTYKKLTQEDLANLTDADFQSILYQAISLAKETDKKLGTKTDINNITVFTARVDNLLALVTAKNIFRDGKDRADILYLIPTSCCLIKIYASFNWDEEILFSPIIKRILSSIKIGKE